MIEFLNELVQWTLEGPSEVRLHPARKYTQERCVHISADPSFSSVFSGSVAIHRVLP